MQRPRCIQKIHICVATTQGQRVPTGPRHGHVQTLNAPHHLGVITSYVLRLGVWKPPKRKNPKFRLSPTMPCTLQCTSSRVWTGHPRSQTRQGVCRNTRRGCTGRPHHNSVVSGQTDVPAAGLTAMLTALLLSSTQPASAMEETVQAAGTATKYVPSPMEGPTWQVYVGAIVGVIPFIIATYEFSKRVIIQRRCRVCNGTGLVLKGTSKYYKKCRACGGFLPWLGWRAFLTGSFTGIANGSPVLPPEGQTSVFYKIPDLQRDDTPSTQADTPPGNPNDQHPTTDD